MKEPLFELYWSELPEGRENAWGYDRLCSEWGMTERGVRRILHELSGYDNGDNLILIRSSHGRGFYKTDDRAEIEDYRRECLNRGKRTFAPLRKIDRVLKPEVCQLSMTNNLKAVRLALDKTQTEVCQHMRVIDPAFDPIMLSRMENDHCLPTPMQLSVLAEIYDCTPRELIDIDLYHEAEITPENGLQAAQNGR